MTHESIDATLWPARRDPTLDWLVNETTGERFLDRVFLELCRRLEAAGLPLLRAVMILQIDNPQWAGVRVLWRRGAADVEARMAGFDARLGPSYLVSPTHDIHEGAPEIRARLWATDPADDPYPLYADLRDEGVTDYVAWPLRFTLGRRNVVTFATDRPGGFAEADVALLADLMPALALVADVRVKNRLARTLLDTYVGPHAGEAILNGATRRGSGFTVEAAIVVVDLRGFTAISDLWPRDDVIALLNDYFDALSEPIEAHGGEILKFMGDGLLAIFPDDAQAAIAAVAGIRAAMADLNVRRIAEGREPLGYGVGVNYGDVMYGNIGSRKRLDFTVIGPAVNIASRLETLTKEVGATALFSAAFVEHTRCGASLRRLGSFPLRGVGQPLDVYTFAEDAAR
ncbi:adenylate/guanylate cyclase domain-containing protein [Lichenibacterium dinghuense]|uniref:adenylate/guanylate cyclase domain-containing protein n=1 Tax=Lichenibacterium dinghuense TaxID=2895977 RepID=UPI001F412390|nr:adenylate/guanylate cyclase domain-containing protein [Lichenibacterium sp. 6Y81]